MSATEEPLAEDRVRALLDAVVVVAGDLDLHATLERVAEAASQLADARYVALGVLNRAGDGLVDFITHGVTPEEHERIGALPAGHGILGLLITDAQPIRLRDLAEHPAATGFPAHHPPMTSFLGVPVRVGGRVFGNLYLTEKRTGDGFTAEDERAVVALAAAAGVAIENARLFEQVRRSERWLGATADIQRRLLGRVDRADALRAVASRARTTAGADVALVVLEQDDERLVVEAVDTDDGGEHGARVGTALPREGALSDVVDRAATVRLTEGVRVSGLERVESAMLVPFTGPGGAGGALVVGSCEPHGGRWIDEPDMDALRGFATQVALALDRAQAQEDREALAVLRDRDRIGRDLHDLVIQRLFATGLSLQAVSRTVGDDHVAQRLRSVVDDLDETIDDIRGTIFELGHEVGADDLRARIREVVAEAGQTLGFAPRLTLRGPVDTAVGAGVRAHLVAVLVEALSNAARHAAAGRVDVRVAVDHAADRVVVTVEDDGRGFDETTRESGLRNLRERADEVAGACEVTSVPGSGTRVRWAAPLNLSPHR